ncbi:hypothetical protein C8R46DRAFT_1041583 [Mycena filopes]|nr:hypothetical protein C8R46DRAFT_1041583 [Mycena filopes]
MTTFAQYKPHHRQEGFHLPSPPPAANTPPPNHHDGSNIFGSMGHSSNNAFNAGDFNDDLANLIGGQSNERSTQSPVGYGDGSSSSSNGDGGGYRNTHNIFDISAPHSAQHHHHGSASSTSSSFPAHFSLPSSSTPSNANHGGGGGGSPGANGDAPQPTPQYHFNSTLPALNSSMRYDPHPPPSSAGSGYGNSMASPSSFRSPSPHTSRSRSRSRPPSSHLAQQRESRVAWALSEIKADLGYSDAGGWPDAHDAREEERVVE